MRSAQPRRGRPRCDRPYGGSLCGAATGDDARPSYALVGQDRALIAVRVWGSEDGDGLFSSWVEIHQERHHGQDLAGRVAVWVLASAAGCGYGRRRDTFWAEDGQDFSSRTGCTTPARPRPVRVTAGTSTCCRRGITWLVVELVPVEWWASVRLDHEPPCVVHRWGRGPGVGG